MSSVFVTTAATTQMKDMDTHEYLSAYSLWSSQTVLLAYAVDVVLLKSEIICHEHGSQINQL